MNASLDLRLVLCSENKNLYSQVFRARNRLTNRDGGQLVVKNKMLTRITSASSLHSTRTGTVSAINRTG